MNPSILFPQELHAQRWRLMFWTDQPSIVVCGCRLREAVRRMHESIPEEVKFQSVALKEYVAKVDNQSLRFRAGQCDNCNDVHYSASDLYLLIKFVEQEQERAEVSNG